MSALSWDWKQKTDVLKKVWVEGGRDREGRVPEPRHLDKVSRECPESLMGRPVLTRARIPHKIERSETSHRRSLPALYSVAIMKHLDMYFNISTDKLFITVAGRFMS